MSGHQAVHVHNCRCTLVFVRAGILEYPDFPAEEVREAWESHKQEMGEVSVMLVEREKGYLELVPKQLEGS